jgi:hypothetical protein
MFIDDINFNDIHSNCSFFRILLVCAIAGLRLRPAIRALFSEAGLDIQN